MIIPICKESGRPCKLPHNPPCGKCDRCESMGYIGYNKSYERKPFDHSEYLKDQANRGTIVQP